MPEHTNQPLVLFENRPILFLQKSYKIIFMNFQIRRCTLNDLEPYARHSIFHLTEKGIGGVFVHPFASDYKRSLEEFMANLTLRWSSEPFSPNWEIAWMAVVDKKPIGHINLRCGGIEATAHRMRLGMGLEAPYRSQGIGHDLLATAMDWAARQDEISWIDLSVFSDNQAARNLYRKFGFEELYTIRDAVRIEGQIIDDVQMVLKV